MPPQPKNPAGTKNEDGTTSYPKVDQDIKDSNPKDPKPNPSPPAEEKPKNGSFPDTTDELIEGTVT